MIYGRFGRESTVLKNGRYIKDLTYMNRPLKDIIYLDFTDDPVELHRENAIIIPKFEGDTSDRNLHDLIPFLDRKFNLLFFSSFSNFFCRFGKVPR
jgi:TFIIF-interacting CTD phosphatase-like protein